MKRFIKKLAGFSCLFLAGLMIIVLLSAIPPFQQVFGYATLSLGYGAGEGETDPTIRAVRAQDSYTKLVVGDCVSKQMFDGLQKDNDTYLMAGNNHALTMAGEYLLIQEFLENHENATDVYLLVGPYTLEAEMSILYGYQYFVAPFAKAGLLDEMDAETYKEAHDAFGGWAMNSHAAKLITNSYMNQKIYLNYLLLKNQKEEIVETGLGELAGVSVRYLPRIKELCDSYGVNLYVLPEPLADTQDMHMQMENFALEWETYGFDTMFPEYFSNVRYYPEEQFPDGIHYGNGYEAQAFMNGIIREMYCEEGYMEDIILAE